MSKKVVLVTGGTGGIGTAICQTLAKQGYTIVAGYNKEGNHAAAQEWQALQHAQGYDIVIAYGNVNDYASTQQMIATAEKLSGPIDILINNAGISRDITFRKMQHEQWLDVINTNLNSLFHTTQCVINGMCERNFGRIVNISSINGQKGQFGQTNYSAAKAGIHGFTMALAQEVAKKGVTVNTISPGYIDTAMLTHIPDHIMENIIATIPIGRLGKPQDIAQVVAFLVHPDSAFITGANIPVNGGQYMSA